jgi:hypothetical protein
MAGIAYDISLTPAQLRTLCEWADLSEDMAPIDIRDVPDHSLVLVAQGDERAWILADGELKEDGQGV